MVKNRSGFILIALVLAFAGSAAAAAGRDVINVPSASGVLELVPVVDRSETADRVIQIQSASDGSGAVVDMRLEAIGPGPIYEWAVFSLRNVGRARSEHVLSLPRRGLIRSGLFWPRLTSSRLLVLATSKGAAPIKIEQAGGDAFAFSLEPGQTITYAGQISGGWPDRLTLWKRDQFNSFARRIAFSKGLLLGIAILAAIYISSLFLIRRKGIFPAAALMAWSGVAFLSIEFGYLPESLGLISAFDGAVRAMVEALVAASILGFLFIYLELRRTIPVAALATLLALALTVLGAAVIAFSPAVASGIIRIIILGSVAAGGAMICVLAVRRFERARALIPTWLFLIVWMFGAVMSASGLADHQLLALGLDSGVILILLLLAFTASQFAFASTLLSSGMDLDVERRALALRGAEQCIWDLDTERQRFHVGVEMERMLDLDTGTLKSVTKDAWLELMHPEDRVGYLSAIKSIIEQGNRRFEQEFRLRRRGGAFRWFRLRGRAFSGENGSAHRLIGAMSDITAEKRAANRLLRDSIHDPVTKLPNRALFKDRLDQAFVQAKSDRPVAFSILLVDLDRFKRVNDGLGHTVGDSLLLETAMRLRNHLRPHDTLARISGDQFGIIVSHNGDASDIAALAERMRAAIADPVKIGPREIFLTASIGIANYDPEAANAAELVSEAEIALQYAKRLGKNKVEVFNTKMADRRGHRYTLEADLRHAIGRGEIEIAYQPIAQVMDLKIAGFEALARWQHPRLGLLSPYEFIDIAEESGLIVELGNFVLDEAARYLAAWQHLSNWSKPLFISVNVSSRQILNQDLVGKVRTVLEQHNLQPGTLKLEITESLTMANPEISAQVLVKLKELGAGLSVDDFGTGYSSLSYLPRFPFDTVKIDASFIQNAKYNKATAIILRTITRLAHDLDMQVVAEGVEVERDIELLRLYECEYAQGFYLGQPMNAQAVDDYLTGKTRSWPQVEALKGLKTATNGGPGVAARPARTTTPAARPAPVQPAPVQPAPARPVPAPMSPVAKTPAALAPVKLSATTPIVSKLPQMAVRAATLTGAANASAKPSTAAAGASATPVQTPAARTNGLGGGKGAAKSKITPEPAKPEPAGVFDPIKPKFGSFRSTFRDKT